MEFSPALLRFFLLLQCRRLCRRTAPPTVVAMTRRIRRALRIRLPAATIAAVAARAGIAPLTTAAMTLRTLRATAQPTPQATILRTLLRTARQILQAKIQPTPLRTIQPISYTHHT